MIIKNIINQGGEVIKRIIAVLVCFAVLAFSFSCVLELDVQASESLKANSEGAEGSDTRLQDVDLSNDSKIPEENIIVKQVITETVSEVGNVGLVKRNRASSTNSVINVKSGNCDFIVLDSRGNHLFTIRLSATFQFVTGEKVRTTSGICYYPEPSTRMFFTNEYSSAWVKNKTAYHVDLKITYNGGTHFADMKFYCNTYGTFTSDMVVYGSTK